MNPPQVFFLKKEYPGNKECREISLAMVQPKKGNVKKKIQSKY